MNEHIYSVGAPIQTVDQRLRAVVLNKSNLPKIHIFYIYWINIYNKYAKFYNDRRSLLRWWTNLCHGDPWMMWKYLEKGKIREAVTISFRGRRAFHSVQHFHFGDERE